MEAWTGYKMPPAGATLVPVPTLPAQVPDVRNPEEVVMRATADVTLTETNRASNSSTMRCDESLLADQ